MRRNLLAIAFGVLMLSQWASAQEWSREDAAHLLRRAGFGGTAQQIDTLHSYGRTAAVEYLIGGTVPTGKQPVFAKVELPAFKMAELPKDPKERIRESRMEIARMRNWWLDRMVRTDRPLDEKMVLFWHGLFCSGVREVRQGEFMVTQNELFHTHAMGNYKKLTAQVIRDPAMLLYLNAEQNVKGKPNENLARELMELFTMGEGNGYTEKDIAEVARSLTGAMVNRRAGEYAFLRFRHDEGKKTIFGQTGDYTPSEIVDLIFSRPQPAQYLARRLWVNFVSPEPSPAELEPIVQAIRKNEYDLKPALRAIFTSPAFYSERAKFSLIRSPVELMVGTCRTLNVTPGPATQRQMVQAMDQMGQELFQPPNVRGWPGGEAWITSATLYTRYNTCSSLATGQSRDTRSPDVLAMFPKLKQGMKCGELVDAAIATIMQRPLHEKKRAALIEAAGPQMLVSSDRNTETRVRQVIALIMSTPEYQVH